MIIEWSPLALDRVVEIAAYIYEDKPAAADKWIHEVFNRIKQLDAHPYSGRIVPEILKKSIREIIFGNYRIIYRIDGQRVDILTVRHAKQILPVSEIVIVKKPKN